MEKCAGRRGHSSIVNEYCNPFGTRPSLLGANTSTYAQNKILDPPPFQSKQKVFNQLPEIKILYFKESDISYVCLEA